MNLPSILQRFIYFCLALVGVSEEVRSRCHVKHSLPRYISESISQENFATEQQNSNVNANTTSATNRRQKSWDLLDQNALAQARQQKQQSAHQVCIVWGFLCTFYF